MTEQLMLLPNKDFNNMLLVRVPDDFEGQEAFRRAVGIIAEIESLNKNYSLDDLINALEDHGFMPITFVLGPEIV